LVKKAGIGVGGNIRKVEFGIIDNRKKINNTAYSQSNYENGGNRYTQPTDFGNSDNKIRSVKIT